MRRHLALARLSLGLALMLIPLAVFLKTSASDSVSNAAAPGLARLGDRVTAHSQGQSAPLINLADGREVLTTYAGDPEAQRLLQQNLVQPLAIASSDFDEDGVPDLVSGYSAPNGGLLTLHRGNADSIYPNSPEARQRKTNGTFTDAPFISPARAFETPRPVDFIGCGDFDADGHYDIVTAARQGSTLFFFPGDGHGNLSAPRQVEMPGRVTAMAAGEMDRADGLTDIVVGISGADGQKALLLEGPEGALGAIPETFALSSEATSLVLGQFDNDSPMDLAVASGSELMIVRGQGQRVSIDGVEQTRTREDSIERRSFSFALSSLAVGDFTGRRQDELAILGENGTLHLLSRPAKARKSALLQRWLDETLPDSWPGARLLVRAHVSSMPNDDLVVIDSNAHQLQLVARQQKQPSSVMSESLDIDGEPIAVLPMRLNTDALSDLVILRRNAASPSVVTTQVAMTFTAISIADNGVGSLRQAIIDANNNAGADTINFAIGSGQQTINLLSPLPQITEAVTIDASTQPGFIGSPLIELNGSAVPAGGSALFISSGNCTVRALVINRLTDNAGSGGVAIILQTGGNNRIEGNFIGTDVAGNAALGNRTGVFISDSPGNTVGGMLTTARNVISGNTGVGIVISSGATGNQIQGNLIGTNAAGNADLGNGSEGVQLEGAANTTIGGAIVTARNVISGNGDQGILARLGATGNLVQGNFIGTNAAGTAAVGNSTDGIFVQDSTNNTIGGTAAGAGNLLSGNTASGVEIGGPASTGNLVQGNLVGTNAAGTAALGNSEGVHVGSASNNTIGGTSAGARNIISGNASVGVFMTGAGAMGNQVHGNFIGTNAAGTAAVGNTNGGVFVQGLTNNTIGGTAAGARNLISGNGGNGLDINGGSTNTAQGNFIGTDVNGTAALPNAQNGIAIIGSNNNVIGGTAAGAGNVISGNGGGGLGVIAGSGNTVQGNFIGTNAAGTAALGNFQGVIIVDSPGNTVGGAVAGARNIISGNNDLGLNITNPGSTNNLVQGNFIGTDVTGAGALGNGNGGVGIGNAASNTVGGATAAARNVISGNGANGVVLATSANGNIIQGNFIGINQAGNAALMNIGSGVTIFDSSNVTITANVISGNGDDGVHLDNTAPGGQSNTVRGNFIGTNPAGTASIPNADNGVVIFNMPNNIIGGTIAAERNIISGNGSANPASDGVEIGGNLATGTQVQGNFIGTDVNGAADLGNSGSGVLINDAPNNIIGGASAAARNIISGNDQNGTLIIGSQATGNQVQSNFIGTDASGNLPLPNSLSGVATGSSNNIIGGAGTGNTIAFNGAIGVTITSGAGNATLSNSIFSNAGVGINLNDDGGAVTPNDNCDGDSGANNLQNFPVLTTANSSPGNTTIVGTLNSTTATTFRIEFFSNAACDPSGNGEGQTFIGFTNVATPGACDVTINVSFPVTVPVGSVITATATDPLNNTSEFSQCVIVSAPAVCTIACPPDLIAFTSPSASGCGTVVTFSPQTSGGCGTVTCAPPSGSLFAVGTTAVTCNVDGGPGCSFNVTVVDQTPPTITCSTGVVATLPAGQQSAVVNYPAPTASDNCSIASVVCAPPSGSAFPVGATLVTCTATDASDNANRCFFFVSVVDGEAPVIRCPANVNAALPGGQTSTVVNYPPPTVTDNRSGVNVVCVPASGSSFPAGVTAVICTATDTAGNKSSCGFSVSVGGPQAKVILPGNKPTIDFAAEPARKRRKPKNNPCTFFTIQNIGFAPLVLTFDSLARTGADVDSGRTTNPNDTRFFDLSLVKLDESLAPFEMGAVLTLQPGQSQTICIRFNALIPALAGKTSGLAASNILPDILTSQLIFKQNAGANIAIPIVARVATALVLVNLDNPRAPAEVIFTRSGNDIAVSYAVFDPNLDVSRAKYEFLDSSGQVVAGPFEIDLAGPVRSLNLVRGQSFRVDQRFTGASSHPEITSGRLTVFDGETSVGTASTASVAPASAAGVQLMNRERRVTLYLPDVALRPQLP